MDSYNHVSNGYSYGKDLGTEESEARGVSDLLASLNQMDIDTERVLVLEKDFGSAEKSHKRPGGIKQTTTVEFVDVAPETEAEESEALSPQAKTIKKQVVEQMDLYDPVDTDEGDDFAFDSGDDLSADDFGMFSILSSHLEEEQKEDDDLDRAYDEELVTMFSEIYSEADTLSNEALREADTYAAPKMAKFLTGMVNAKELVGAGAM